MSLTIIAIAGVLLGFLCLLVGFFMDTQEPVNRIESGDSSRGRERRMKTIKRRAMGLKRKAA